MFNLIMFINVLFYPWGGILESQQRSFISSVTAILFCSHYMTKSTQRSKSHGNSLVSNISFLIIAIQLTLSVTMVICIYNFQFSFGGAFCWFYLITCLVLLSLSYFSWKVEITQLNCQIKWLSSLENNQC